jgi:hypothetical protein
MTKKQRSARATKSSKQRRVATALAKYLKARNPGIKLRLAKIKRNPGGVRVLPVKMLRNVAAGFYDEDGIFHPIRASFAYSGKRAGEGARKRSKAKKSRRKKR